MPSIDAGAAAWLLAAGMSGCASQPAPIAEVPFGLRHDAGSSFVEARAYSGIPILQKSFFWDGNGEVDDSGLGLHLGKYLGDGVAMGVGSNLGAWWTSGSNVYSAELEALLRVHPVSDWPVFVDGHCGYQLATGQIPPGGTVWNFSFGFGAGVEFPIDVGTAILAAVDYHHISNALGRDNDRNPSQNEARIWIGLEWNF